MGGIDGAPPCVARLSGDQAAVTKHPSCDQCDECDHGTTWAQCTDYPGSGHRSHPATEFILLIVMLAAVAPPARCELALHIIRPVVTTIKLNHFTSLNFCVFCSTSTQFQYLLPTCIYCLSTPPLLLEYLFLLIDMKS